MGPSAKACHDQEVATNPFPFHDEMYGDMNPPQVFPPAPETPAGGDGGGGDGGGGQGRRNLQMIVYTGGLITPSRAGERRNAPVVEEPPRPTLVQPSHTGVVAIVTEDLPVPPYPMPAIPATQILEQNTEEEMPPRDTPAFRARIRDGKRPRVGE